MRTASEKLLRKKDKKDEPCTEILCVCVILSNEGKKTQYGNIERKRVGFLQQVWFVSGIYIGSSPFRVVFTFVRRMTTPSAEVAVRLSTAYLSLSRNAKKPK